MDVWNSLGFKSNPYDSSALEVNPQHVDLLVGRAHETIQFISLLDAIDKGVIIVSGPAGVGKTSFFNVTQEQLERSKLVFGKRLLAARELFTINQNDTLKDIALRILQCLCKSIESYRSKVTDIQRKPLKTVDDTLKWFTTTESSGNTIGVAPPFASGSIASNKSDLTPNSVTFETIQNKITAIVAEVVQRWGYEGVFICFDNIEDLPKNYLVNLMMTLRDTLFRIPNVTWVLIGQAGLGSLIASADPRVSQRLSGEITLKSLSFDQLSEAILKRVHLFRSRTIGHSPLSENIHRLLYDSSQGETRFVFKYANDICVKFIQSIRNEVITSLSSDTELSEILRGYSAYGFETHITKAISEKLSQNHIDDEYAKAILKSIITPYLESLDLNIEQKNLLKEIGTCQEKRKISNVPADSYHDEKIVVSTLNGKLMNIPLIISQEGKLSTYGLHREIFVAFKLGMLN